MKMTVEIDVTGRGKRRAKGEAGSEKGRGGVFGVWPLTRIRSNTLAAPSSGEGDANKQRRRRRTVPFARDRCGATAANGFFC